MTTNKQKQPQYEKLDDKVLEGITGGNFVNEWWNSQSDVEKALTVLTIIELPLGGAVWMAGGRQIIKAAVKYGSKTALSKAEQSAFKGAIHSGLETQKVGKWIATGTGPMTFLSGGLAINRHM